MKEQDYTITILVDQSPRAAYRAINNPRAWWGEDIEGVTDRVGEEWTYRYKDMHYSKQLTAEMTPDRHVVWNVIDSALSFLNDKTEWNGTKIVFDISAKGQKTEVRFTHVGLRPEGECFETCSSAWSSLIRGSLRRLIETGSGRPDELED